MSLFKTFQLFSKKGAPDSYILDHLVREINHRDQVLRKKQQAVGDRLQSLYETNHRLKEAETVPRRFDETERVFNEKFEDLRIREEQLVADRALLHSRIEDLNQKLADPDSRAAKIVKEEMQIKSEKERLIAEEDELSRKDLQLEERQREHQKFEDNLKAPKEELPFEEKTLKETIAERLNQIEKREKEVGLREEFLEAQAENLEAKRSELAAQEQTIAERLNQIFIEAHAANLQPKLRRVGKRSALEKSPKRRNQPICKPTIVVGRTGTDDC